MVSYSERLIQASQAIQSAECILIGGGSGLSASAGLEYSGKRFTDHFADFIQKYGLQDMYSASFYPFETEEELWAHWARHIDVNRYSQGPTVLYQNLVRMVDHKEFFILTTNVESQFEKGGFKSDKIFEMQGNYAFLQCARACHDRLYYNEPLVKEMLAATVDCRIPTALVPKCPVCGGPMDVNLRKKEFFVQDVHWYEASERYSAFLKKERFRKIVFLEMGVGFNTPGIIRIPFERMTYQNQKARLIRFNRDYPEGAEENTNHTITFDEDMSQVVVDLLEKLNA